MEAFENTLSFHVISLEILTGTSFYMATRISKYLSVSQYMYLSILLSDPIAIYSYYL